MMPAFLQLDYLSMAELMDQSSAWWSRVLGVVGFDALPAIDLGRVPIAASRTPRLDSADDRCEVWRVAGDVHQELSSTSARWDRISYRYCEEFLFGSLAIDAGEESASSLHSATLSAYRDIFALIRDTGHPNLLRIWNYLPQINRDADGDERYRIFNAARQAAFVEWGRATVGSVPAACALGSPAGNPLSVYFLASRSAPTTIENPRQISAYHYPPKFGKHSPTFSRACVLRDTSGTNLFVSGTASIVGFDTAHGGDVMAQTREILTNIGALLGEANRAVGSDRYSIDALNLKVYVRRAADLDAIRTVVGERGAASPLYLQADICREDLLVEIEASGGAAC